MYAELKPHPLLKLPALAYKSMELACQVQYVYRAPLLELVRIMWMSTVITFATCSQKDIIKSLAARIDKVPISLALEPEITTTVIDNAEGLTPMACCMNGSRAILMADSLSPDEYDALIWNEAFWVDVGLFRAVKMDPSCWENLLVAMGELWDMVAPGTA
jgi:hypothetical protein